MLYLHVRLFISRLCHALCPLWAYACVVTFVPPRVCLDVSMCGIHPRGVSVLDICLSPPSAMLLAMLALHHPFGFLCFLASLYACLHVHAWVCVSSILHSNGTMDTRSNPTFILLGHPLLFDNMLLCLFMCFTCLFALIWHLSYLVLARFSFHLFLCLSSSLFLLSLHVHAWNGDAWSKGATF